MHACGSLGAVRGALFGALTTLLVLVVALWSQPAAAVEIGFTTKPVLRKVLALYDGAAEATPTETRIHRFAEMPLNHLGFVLEYRDINKPLPAAGELAGYRAILTWLLEPVAKPAEFGAWLEQATATPGLRYVVLGEVLPEDGEHNVAIAQRLYGRLGLRYTGEHLENGFAARVATLEPAMIGFERPLDKVLPEFPLLEVAPEMQGQVAVHLSLTARIEGAALASAVVATGTGGGIAAEGFTIYFEPTADRITWILNPFAFFARALGAERFPVPDVTTAAGRRIYFSHIDGDGWNNQSEIEPYKSEAVLSSEVIRREAIAAYPDLPVSVALISCDIDPEFGGTPASQSIARALFALPQVEVASHTHTHPFNWQFYQSYDRSAEMKLVDTYARPTQSWREALSERVHLLAGKPAPVTRSSKYIAGSDDLPRSFLKNPFDLGSEVTGSLKIAEAIAPAGKKARLYQWSGDTQPFEAAIRATRLAGVRNINGGDSRLDREYPSVAYVPAIARSVGRERQIYAANSNENTYTNDWTGPYYGFFMLEETLKNTEKPRRLKPFNLYYHMYSGEKPAALAAIRHFLDLARSSRVVPVAASDYATIADDFFGVEIEQLGAMSWAVSSRGMLETVRFDDAETLGLDLGASVGVLGATRANGSLYVTLDREAARAIVTLGERALTEAAARAPDQRLSLTDSRWRIWGLAGDHCRTSFRAQGFGHGDMMLQTSPGRRVEAIVRRGAATLAKVLASADGEGRLQLALAADAIEPVEVEVVCHG